MSAMSKKPRSEREELFALLETDHRAARDLLDQLAEALDDEPAAARDLLIEVRRHLLAHARAEERALYAALECHDATRDLAHEGREEHAVVEHLLAALCRARAVDDAFKAKVKVMTEIVDHHVDEEEQQLFPKMRAAIDPADRRAIAEEFLAQKGRELARVHESDAELEALLRADDELDADDADPVIRGYD